MGKKSRNKPVKQTGADTAPAPTTASIIASLGGSSLHNVDLSAIDTSKCCRCNKDIPPLSWKEKEWMLETCCGSAVCRECADYIQDSQGAAKRCAATISDALNEKTMPDLLELHKELHHPCAFCGSLPPSTQQQQLKQLTRLADAGQKDAQYVLGCRYFKGINGVSHMKRLAMQLLRKAADQGHALAQASLGDRFMKGDSSEGQNYRTAKEWFEKAPPSERSAIALDALGHIYRDGHGGVPVDTAKATELFEKSAAQGFLADAGREKEALEWFIKGGEDERWLKGYQTPIATCQFHAAYLSFKMDRNLPNAIFWGNRAKRNGHSEAKGFVEDIEKLVWLECECCEKPSPTERCVACKSVAYCNRKCQIADWKAHKVECSNALPTIITKTTVYEETECSLCYKSDPVRVCGRCMGAYYCDNDRCQQAHWTLHKVECKKKKPGKPST
jgi:TPR repeat protein